MARTTTFYGSSVGKKVIMAVTGGLMALFLVMHMLGNLCWNFYVFFNYRFNITNETS